MDYSQAFWPKLSSLFEGFLLPFEGAMKPRFSSSAPLQMYFSLESFLAKVKIFSFWPKTMDYSQAFWPKLSSLFEGFLLPFEGCYEAEIFIICSPSDVL